MASLRQFVAGVHLHGKRLCRVDELHQQWELRPEAPEVLLPEQSPAPYLRQLREGEPVIKSACHPRFLPGNAGKLPALAHRLFGRSQPLEGENALAAP